jgi:hypothetical protein
MFTDEKLYEESLKSLKSQMLSALKKEAVHADVLENSSCAASCNFQLPIERIDIWILD